MKNPVIAIGLDSAEPSVVENWIDQGHLKTLGRLKAEGAYGRLTATVPYQGTHEEFSNTEPLWVMFSTGCLPDKTGFWDTAEFDPQDYRVLCDKIDSGYRYDEYPPFYALGEDYRVAIFDIPVSRLSNEINGIQSIGWGGHFPFVPSESNPPEFLPSVIEKYGKNPLLFKDNGSWWNSKYSEWLKQQVEVSTTRRAAICQDLLKQEPWDLFITTFGDTHSVSHDFWDQSQPDHPLHPIRRNVSKGVDPLLNGYKAVDRAVGKILEAAPDDAYVVCYSVHGMGANVTDLLSMMFLAEVMYRFNFPGKQALAPGDIDELPPPPTTSPIRGAWPGEVWSKIYEPNAFKRLFNTWAPKSLLMKDQHGLASPYRLTKQKLETDEPIYLEWMPATWYRPLWPTMKAFALPAFADGHIRINLKGREGQGIVEPSDYDALCDEITDMLYRLTDGRTGNPLVSKIVRTRRSPLEDDKKLHHADLIVIWHNKPADVVDSPDVGRIGPITFNRPGSHRAQGTFFAKGPGIQPGTTVSKGHPVDLAPTILNLMGATLPDHLDGKPLIKPVYEDIAKV